MLQLKDCINFLNCRSEFLALQTSQIKYATLSCVRQSAVFNQEWLDFNTKSLILKVSDGKPRYVYFGKLYITLDSNNMAVLYRDDIIYQILSLEYALTSEFNLFDRTTFTGAASLSWQFTGFIIDRGV